MQITTTTTRTDGQRITDVWPSVTDAVDFAALGDEVLPGRVRVTVRRDGVALTSFTGGNKIG